jgi:hypothetical protein
LGKRARISQRRVEERGRILNSLRKVHDPFDAIMESNAKPISPENLDVNHVVILIEDERWDHCSGRIFFG